MYDNRDVSIFDLAQNYGALNWVDKKLTENIELYEHMIKRRNQEEEEA